ncbi:hypothetical protein [Streptococcus cuniculi]|uniref:Uncharacterized protein n=1 Tax=Streptococcus cuniculi TaxID=1432788 RepID=A0A4Y9J9X3_9STRE|nr:hypothetical protein [Streptococcus cuniculi]MBF0778338.1 hypothetical protein [Streptococcus cuniculi]TFU97830.1 hypothetical protein E4T82_06300 [Streptococcus cuniculi]
MYDVLELTLHKDKLNFFGFLKNNPTRTLRNGEYYKFIYLQPLEVGLANFSYRGITVKIVDQVKEEHWQLVRDLPIAVAGVDLIEVLEDLEIHRLEQARQGQGLELSGWVFDTITNGLFTEQETAYFIRIMFLHGYDFDQLISLFSAIVKRIDLAGYFLTTARKIYKGVEFG